MSDSDEDDYMSDKLLTGSEKADVRPGLLYSNTQKRSHDLFKKQVEESAAKRPKSYREQESELREKGLSTAIPSDNVGFKLLEKMGYKAGSSLGKTAAGIKEPVGIVIKESSSGVGREQHQRNVFVKKQKQKELNLKMREKEFRAANAEKKLMYILRSDYFKAQRICEELDARNKVSEPLEDFFWTKATIDKLRRKESDEEDDDSDDSQQDEDVTENKLQIIISYLRERYTYCMYCAITGTDENDLRLNCPGPYRNDHEDSM